MKDWEMWQVLQDMKRNIEIQPKGLKRWIGLCVVNWLIKTYPRVKDNLE